MKNRTGAEESNERTNMMIVSFSKENKGG